MGSKGQKSSALHSHRNARHNVSAYAQITPSRHCEKFANLSVVNGDQTKSMVLMADWRVGRGRPRGSDGPGEVRLAGAGGGQVADGWGCVRRACAHCASRAGRARPGRLCRAGAPGRAGSRVSGHDGGGEIQPVATGAGTGRLGGLIAASGRADLAFPRSARAFGGGFKHFIFACRIPRGQA